MATTLRLVAVTVAYPGRDGAHSAAACERLFPDVVPTPLPSFAAVVEATSSGAVGFGVLPIESSLSGPVNETHDLLYGSPLSITAETVLPSGTASSGLRPSRSRRCARCTHIRSRSTSAAD